MAAGGTKRCPGPAGRASPNRSATELVPMVIARKIITGKSGMSGIPMTEMRSNSMSGRSSSQQRNPTRKLFSGCSNIACPT